MPGRWNEDEDLGEGWDDADAQPPQEGDLTDGDEEDTPTVTCPHCRRAVAELAEQCPYCGDWIVTGSGSPGRRSAWFLLGVLAAGAAILLWYVL